MTVDRPNRDRLISVINRYLDEVTTAFEFDEQLYTLREATEDSAIHAAVDLLWYTYDDLIDHKVTLTKDGWDYCQRLLLALQSDCQLQWTRDPERSAVRWAPLLVLIASVALGLAIGVRPLLLLVWIEMWFSSLLIAEFWIDQEKHNRDILNPFFSTAQLHLVHRRIPAFRKRAYPRSIHGRKLRTGLDAALMGIYFYGGWFLLAPFALALQSLPSRPHRLRVVEESAPATGQPKPLGA